MENLVKKLLYTSVGVVAVAAEKIQETANELVKNGKLSEEEGKKLVDDVLSDIGSKREEFEGRFNTVVNKIVNTIDMPSKSEITALKARIAELESQLNDDSKEVKKVAKKTTRKATAKKTTSQKTVSEEENVNN